METLIIEIQNCHFKSQRFPQIRYLKIFQINLPGIVFVGYSLV